MSREGARFGVQILRIAIGGLMALMAGPAVCDAGPVLYVSVADDNRIDVWSIDPASGALTKTSQVALDGSPGPLATDPGRKLLFVALRPEGRLISFQIAPGSGALSEQSRTDLKTDPVDLATAAAGQFILSADSNNGAVAAFRLAPDRRLPILGRWTQTTPGARAIVPHPRVPTTVLVPHASCDRIYLLKFNATAAELTPGPIPYILTPDHTGPGRLAFHPSLNRFYVANEQGNNVAHYRYETTDATPVFVELHSTLPEGVLRDNTPSEIRFRQGGKVLYVTNRGHDSIASFSVNPKDGRLLPAGHFATEPDPGAFDLDPSGTFLYVAGESSGRISAHRIENETGALRRFAQYEAGQRPCEIHCVNVP